MPAIGILKHQADLFPKPVVESIMVQLFFIGNHDGAPGMIMEDMDKAVSGSRLHRIKLYAMGRN
jgi:hypothetical protein